MGSDQVLRSIYLICLGVIECQTKHTDKGVYKMFVKMIISLAKKLIIKVK